MPSRLSRNPAPLLNGQRSLSPSSFVSSLCRFTTGAVPDRGTNLVRAPYQRTTPTAANRCFTPSHGLPGALVGPTLHHTHYCCSAYRTQYHSTAVPACVLRPLAETSAGRPPSISKSPQPRPILAASTPTPRAVPAGIPFFDFRSQTSNLELPPLRRY